MKKFEITKIIKQTVTITVTSNSKEEMEESLRYGDFEDEFEKAYLGCDYREEEIKIKEI